MVRRYCPQMLGTMMKGYDKRFKDQQDVNINVGGGVLAVPMDPVSAEDWHKQYDQPAIDVTEESRALTPKLPEPKK